MNSMQISEDIARRAEEFAKIERERKRSEENRKKEAERREKVVVAERRNVRKDLNLRPLLPHFYRPH